MNQSNKQISKLPKIIPVDRGINKTKHDEYKDIKYVMYINEEYHNDAQWFRLKIRIMDDRYSYERSVLVIQSLLMFHIMSMELKLKTYIDNQNTNLNDRLMDMGFE